MSANPQGKRETISITDVPVRDVSVTVVKILVREIHDAEVIEAIGGQLYSLVEEHGRAQLLINLEQVESYKSYFLGKLFGVKQRTNKVNGKLALCQLTPIVQEGLDAAGLTNYFAIYPDEATALRKHF